MLLEFFIRYNDNDAYMLLSDNGTTLIPLIPEGTRSAAIKIVSNNQPSNQRWIPKTLQPAWLQKMLFSLSTPSMSALLLTGCVSFHKKAHQMFFVSNTTCKFASSQRKLTSGLIARVHRQWWDYQIESVWSGTDRGWSLHLGGKSKISFKRGVFNPYLWGTRIPKTTTCTRRHGIYLDSSQPLALTRTSLLNPLLHRPGRCRRHHESCHGLDQQGQVD